MKNLVKKTFSGILTAILAVTMLLTIGGGVTPAYAATNASITIHPGNPTETESNDPTYQAYKIFDAVKSDDSKGTSQNEKGGAITNVSGAVSYTISNTNPWFAVLFNEDGTAKSTDQVWVTAARQGNSNTYNVSGTTSLTDATAQAFAKWLNNNKPSGATVIPFTKQEDGSYKTATNLDTGYYLITSTIGTQLILATSNVDMYEKNNYPSNTKEQKVGEGNFASTDVSQEIGKTVDYQVEVMIPSTANKEVVVTDIISKGLTMGTSVTGTVTAATGTGNVAFSAPDSVTGWTKDAETADGTKWAGSWGTGTACQADGTVSDDATKNTYTKYEVTIPENLVRAIVDTYGTAGTTTAGSAKFTLTYTATVNKDAVVTDGTDASANANSAHIKYDNFVTKDVTVKTRTSDFNLRKTFADSEDTNLTATFELRRESATGTAIDLTQDATGYAIADSTEDAANKSATITVKNNDTVNIRGLAADTTYYLVETGTADGYNKLANAVEVKVDKDGKISFINRNNAATETDPAYSATVTVENTQGSVLPSTGGIGTTIFYVIGGVLIAGAAILLITRRKKA